MTIESALELVDDELLIKTLGIEREICMLCRDIWKKLRRRRLARSAQID